MSVSKSQSGISLILKDPTSPKYENAFDIYSDTLFNKKPSGFNSELKQMRQDAWLKLGIGLYFHAASLFFIEKQYRTPIYASPFGFVNFNGLTLDVLAICDFVKIRKYKKKYGF